MFSPVKFTMGYIELWESKIEQVVDDVRRLDNIYIDRQHEK